MSKLELAVDISEYLYRPNENGFVDDAMLCDLVSETLDTLEKNPGILTNRIMELMNGMSGDLWSDYNTNISKLNEASKYLNRLLEFMKGEEC